MRMWPKLRDAWQRWTAHPNLLCRLDYGGWCRPRHGWKPPYPPPRHWLDSATASGPNVSVNLTPESSTAAGLRLGRGLRDMKLTADRVRMADMMRQANGGAAADYDAMAGALLADGWLRQPYRFGPGPATGWLDRPPNNLRERP